MALPYAPHQGIPQQYQNQPIYMAAAPPVPTNGVSHIPTAIPMQQPQVIYVSNGQHQMPHPGYYSVQPNMGMPPTNVTMFRSGPPQQMYQQPVYVHPCQTNPGSIPMAKPNPSAEKSQHEEEIACCTTVSAVCAALCCCFLLGQS